MATNPKSAEANGGIGFCGLLAILFIGLKLTGYISWSWLWVLSPLWLPILIVLGVLVAMLTGTLAVAAIAALFSGRRS